jgi:hypothetical protein
LFIADEEGAAGSEVSRAEADAQVLSAGEFGQFRDRAIKEFAPKLKPDRAYEVVARCGGQLGLDEEVLFETSETNGIAHRGLEISGYRVRKYHLVAGNESADAVLEEADEDVSRRGGVTESNDPRSQFPTLWRDKARTA